MSCRPCSLTEKIELKKKKKINCCLELWLEELVAFSRYERTYPNFFSQAPETEIFLDCKLAAPLICCRGFGPRFCVHWVQNEARSCFALCFGVFRSVRLTYWGFLRTGFHSDCNRQKEMQSQSRLDWGFLASGEKELNNRKARVYKTICVFDRSRLLVCSSLILDRTWRVWSRCEMKCFCCITGTAIIYSVHWYDFESPQHWDELTVGTAIFYWLQFHCVFWLK